MDNKVDRGGLETIWRGFFDEAPTDAEYKQFVGKTWPSVLFYAITSDRYKNRIAGLIKLVTITEPALREKITTLEAQLAAGSNCTPDERALLDAIYKVVTKKG